MRNREIRKGIQVNGLIELTELIMEGRVAVCRLRIADSKLAQQFIYCSQNNVVMYTGLLKAPEEGICHLFYYCCMKDGKFDESELNNISDKLVTLDLQKKLNFKDEMRKFKSYQNSITDEDMYLQYLISIIKPNNSLALLSWCIELCAADGNVSEGEQLLLVRIGNMLNIGDTEQDLVKRLMIQRNRVLLEKGF